MDNSKLLKSIMNEDTLKMVSKMAGVSESDAGEVISDVLPMLLKGAAEQNKNADTAESFLSAIMEHGSKDTSDMNKFMKNIDLEDGAKIVGHLLGNEGKEKAAAKAKKKSGIDANKVIKIMAILAPIIMSQLGKDAKESGKKDNDAVGGLLGSIIDNVDMKDVLKIAQILIK